MNIITDTIKPGSERDVLIGKYREAVSRGQYDLADEYFCAILEAGAVELDKMRPGAGDPWRGIAKTMQGLREIFVSE